VQILFQQLARTCPITLEHLLQSARGTAQQQLSNGMEEC